MPRPSLVAVLFCLALSSLTAGAAVPLDSPRFASVAPSDIPSGVISSLAEDRDGFLWLGTPAGLVRFDGYRFRLFGNHWSVPGTQSTVFVRSLLADPAGGLWLATDFSGLLRYDRGGDRLERVPLFGDPGRPLTLNALAVDGDGGVWAGSDGEGLFHREPDGDVRIFRAGDGSGLADDRIDSLEVDANGTLWIGTWAGLLRRARGDVSFVPVALPGAGEAHRISALFSDAAGLLWVGTRNGRLMRRDAEGQVADLPTAGDAAPASVFDFLQRADGSVWVARSDGIEIRDALTGQILNGLQHDPDFPQGLAGNEVRALLEDQGGQIWVAGYGGGLQRHNPHNAAFRLVDRHVRAGAMLGDPNVRSIAALKDGRVLLGSQDRGIALLDAQLAPIDLVRDAEGVPLLSGVRISGLAEAGDGSWWIGSDAGLFRYESRTRSLRPVALGPGRVRRLLGGDGDRVWVATESGLYRAGPDSARAEALEMSEGPALDGDINGLALDAEGALWIGGDQGLAVLPAGATRARWLPARHPARSENPDVLGLLAGPDGAIWFDTPVGLFRRSQDASGNLDVQALSMQFGAGGRPFGANLLADDAGRIWTQHRVFDPQRGRMLPLGVFDGVEIGSAWFRSYARMRDGRLLFGGSQGMLVIDPSRYREPDYDAPLVVSEVRVEGQVEALRPGSPLVLGPGRRRADVEFAALDYSAPGQLRYRHRLLGEDARWTDSDARYRVATVANLSPGEYRLEVQASDRHGRWTGQQLALPIRVLPDWYQRLWVQAAGLLLALLAIYLLVRQRTRWHRAREALLEQRVEERTRELQSLSAALKEKSDALEQASLTDPLTGLRNRRYFAAQIDEDVARSRRRHRDAVLRGEQARNADLVFFLVDLDHFKQVNDEYGHAAGDAVLIQMRERLQACFRDTDHLVRWGGEEFLVVSRDADRSRAAELAGRAVRAVSDFAFELPGPRRLRCTCSVGYAALPLQPAHAGLHGWAEAVELADLALYAVKHAGRNGWVGIEVDSTEPLPASMLRAPAGLLEQGTLRLRSSIDESTIRSAILAAADTPRQVDDRESED